MSYGWTDGSTSPWTTSCRHPGELRCLSGLGASSPLLPLLPCPDDSACFDSKSLRPVALRLLPPPSGQHHTSLLSVNREVNICSSRWWVCCHINTARDNLCCWCVRFPGGPLCCRISQPRGLQDCRLQSVLSGFPHCTAGQVESRWKALSLLARPKSLRCKQQKAAQVRAHRVHWKEVKSSQVQWESRGSAWKWAKAKAAAASGEPRIPSGMVRSVTPARRMNLNEPFVL